MKMKVDDGGEEIVLEKFCRMRSFVVGFGQSLVCGNSRVELVCLRCL